MSEKIKQSKRQRLYWLYEEYDAANQQLATELDEVNRVRLKRKLDDLEAQIIELEQELDISASQHLEDIKLLLRHSVQTLKLQSRHAKIDISDQKIKIIRPVSAALQQVMASHSLVVIGEPGAGKSGVLHAVAETFMADNDVVFLTVDSFDKNSRKFLKLAKPLENILLDWQSEKPGYLILDALDAARSSTLRQTVLEFLELIHGQPGRWRIAVSIRKFDLRYNHRLQEMFVGKPPTNYHDPEFHYLHHLNIPLLTDAELSQFTTQAEALAPLVNNAQGSFKELLRIPFNLRLLGEIYAIDEDVSPAQTQIELLERFWHKRIGRNDSKEALLKSVTQAMVETGKLQLARSQINNSDDLIEELLSAHILAEWRPTPTSKPQSRVIEYSHHVLFDYAVARHLLAYMADDFIKQLTDKPSLVLAVRPSLLFHFQHIWQSDPNREWFWQFGQLLLQSDIPAIGKIIAANVAVDMAQDVGDFVPLLNRLQDKTPNIKKAAVELAHHIVSVLQTVPTEALVGENAKDWANLTQQLSQNMDDETIPLVFRLLRLLCEHMGNFTESQRSDCNNAGQRLLGYAWNQPIRNRWFVRSGIEAVARTFVSNSAGSADLLRRSLEPQHLEQYGYEEMPTLAREIGAILRYDSVLVRDIYTAVFSYTETSQEAVFSGGEIIGFQTTRAQDYELARYSLAQTFPHFLRYAPALAIQTLSGVLDTYIDERFSEYGLQHIPPQTFVFRGKSARITTNTYLYGRQFEQSNPIQMLNSFTDYLTAIHTYDELLETALDSIAQYHHCVTVWQRVLTIGTQNPSTMGYAIRSLAWATPVLVTGGLAETMGGFLVAIYPSLTQPEKEQIENIILAIPDDRVNIRKYYLSALSDHLTSEKVRHALATINAEPQPNPPSDWDFEMPFGTPIQPLCEAHRPIFDMITRVKEFGSHNGKPTLQAIETLFPALVDLTNSLPEIEEDAHNLRQEGVNAIVKACERMTKAEGLSYESEMGQFVRTWLLAAAKSPIPTPSPQPNEQFDEHPHWETPAPRISAATALPLIARDSLQLDEEILAVIEELSQDKVPAVRYQIAVRVNTIYKTAPSLMWQLIDWFSEHELSNGVLQGLLKAFQRLAFVDTTQIIAFTKTIFDRVQGAGKQRVREDCVALFLKLCVERENVLSEGIITDLIQQPVDNFAEAQRILLNLRYYLVVNEAAAPEEISKYDKALSLQKSLVSATVYQAHDINSQNIVFSSMLDQDQERVRNLIQLAKSTVSNLYGISGAFAEKHPEERKLAESEKQNFLDDFSPIFTHLIQLIDVQLAGYDFVSISHQLTEIFEVFIPTNPQTVFERIHQLVQASKNGGFKYERLVADSIVRIMERFLAEYSHIIRGEQEHHLIEILDIFVEAGWSEAIRLTYRLHDTFR